MLCLCATLSTESWSLRLRSSFLSTTTPARSSISQAASPMVRLATPLSFVLFCFFVFFYFPYYVSNRTVSISSAARLTINVLDVNDNAPRFRPFGVSNFTEKILEGAQPGTTLLSVSAVDPDKGPNGQVIYQLLHLPRGGYVRLEDPSTGMNPTAPPLGSAGHRQSK